MLLFFILTAILAQSSSQTSPTILPRVMGGDFVESGKYPYHAALLLGRSYHCGGSIISKTFILTAAHCTYGILPCQMHVRVGAIDLRTHDGVSVNAKDFIQHPQYIKNLHDYDYSLIRLSQPLKLGSANINKIELSTAPLNLPEGTVAVVTGFGYISGEKILSPRLKYAHVFVLTRDQCNSQNIHGVTDRMVCTGHPANGINSCQGDSGGPLVVDNKLYGVVSWGFGCVHKDKPAMYAYVGAVLDWIKQNAGV